MQEYIYPSTKVYVPRAKIKGYVLKPTTKHCQEFFAVGYNENDDYRLFKEVEAQFDKTKAIEFRYELDVVSYNIYMILGVTLKRTFKTVWREDGLASLPRLITIHRVGGI